MKWYLVPLMTESHPRKWIHVYVCVKPEHGKARAKQLALEKFTKYTIGGCNSVATSQESVDYMLSNPKNTDKIKIYVIRDD